MSLDSADRSLLVSALGRRYPDYLKLEIFLSLRLGKRLALYAAPGALDEVVFRVVMMAEAEGWIGELVAAAAAESPHEPAFKQLGLADPDLDPENRAPRRAWAVLDVRRHPERPNVSPLRDELEALVTRAAMTASISEARTEPVGAPDRLILGFGPDTPEDVAGLLDALGGLLGARNEGLSLRDRLRVVAAPHEAGPDGSYEEALWILGSPVLTRVLAQAHSAPLVIAFTEAWYEQIRAPAASCSHVRSGIDTFWISVPGQSRLRGLTPSDIAPPSGNTSSGPSGQPRPAGAVRGGTAVHGDYVLGDKIVGNKIVGGHPTGHREPGARRWKDDA